ncbi:uncharacterized protein [Fopius arisanus]|uniref:Endonuclease/exonuclease/phosphatase domain-containing protein n=1 Tax=Fopius arisanus TaxID=64838 RepID=A0A9R1TQP1_9HYME|nr:PREDICTED: uncharacterized protein LOC105272612 [Fopius arisanus]
MSENGTLECMVGSAYLPYDSEGLPPTPEVESLIARVKDEGTELQLGCDANSHHQGWGSSNTSTKGDALHDFLIVNNLLLLNREKEPTFMDCRKQEVLDMTICTADLIDLIRDWRVSKERSGSDHGQIRLKLSGRGESIRRRDPTEPDQTGYKKELLLRIQGVPSRFENMEQLEYTAESFGEWIRRCSDNNCSMRPIKGTKQVSWWNTTLAILRDLVRRAWHKVKNSCGNLRTRKATAERISP